jgi:Sigma-70 region 2
MDIVASQPAIAAPAATGSAVESPGPAARGYSKKPPLQGNNVADPPTAEKATRFEQQIMPLREPLYRHALRMCHNRADAEDLLQDTMVKAYSSFHPSRRIATSGRGSTGSRRTPTSMATVKSDGSRFSARRTKSPTTSWRRMHSACRLDLILPRMRLLRHCLTAKSWRRCSPCPNNSVQWCTTPMSRGSDIGK